jgi:hypothetical protein
LAPSAAKLGGLARAGFSEDHDAALFKDAFPRDDVSTIGQRQIPWHIVVLTPMELDESST